MKKMESVDRTEIFLDRIKAMNKRLYPWGCAGAVFAICFLEFAFMWGDMWGIWENVWSKAGAVVFYIAVIWNLAWVYGVCFFAQYILPQGRDGKMSQSLVPHYVNLPLDVERMLLILKKKFWRGIRYITPLSLFIFTAELFFEFSEIDEKIRLVPAIPTAGRFFWFVIQIVCLLVLCWRMWFSLFADSIKGDYLDRRIGYETREEQGKNLNPAKQNKGSKRKEKRESPKILFLVSFVVAGCVLIYVFFTIGKYIAQVEITTDVKKYQNVIGAQAKEPYRDKWMSEEIFPETISGNVQDFKMVYYDPWDAQYLAYLVVEYEEPDMEQELERLKGCRIEEYEGIYGASGFLKDYELTAMDSDYYHGFVYALQKGNCIIYVEIMFCNFFMDIAYEEYIPKEYLPIGFDATLYNPYEIEQQKQMKEDEHYFDKSNKEE